MKDTIYRQDAIDAICDNCDTVKASCPHYPCGRYVAVEKLPPAQLERLTDSDFETIRIHLNAYKEKLCNQHRWKEAEEYQRIIDRFMAFASAQPEITEEDVREWCYKRCLTIIDNALYLEMRSRWLPPDFCSHAERRTDDLQ